MTGECLGSSRVRRGDIVLDEISSLTQKVESLRLGDDHGLACFTVYKIAPCGVRFLLGEYVPDSGQEHTTDGDNGFLVTAASLDRR